MNIFPVIHFVKFSEVSKLEAICVWGNLKPTEHRLLILDIFHSVTYIHIIEYLQSFTSHLGSKSFSRGSVYRAYPFEGG